MSLILFTFHSISITATGVAILYLYLKREARSVIKTLLLGITLLFGLALTALIFPVDGFARIQLLAWVVFLYFPIFLSLGIYYFWNHYRGAAIGLLVLLLSTLLIGIDSFLIEPHWLKITRIERHSPKIEESLTIAFLADIQTDSPGEYEREVLDIVKRENPDLILMAGDYIQVRDPEDYQREGDILNQIMHDVDLQAELGIYAVRGNVDRNTWNDIFTGLDFHLIEETETFDLGPVMLTGVGYVDSARPSLSIEGADKFHIVLGHSPNFSLGEIEGDLLVAGHTHGGQVQLPGIGPLITISVVPRDWASGLTEIEPGKFLLVSNGIGLERGYAPQMRFWCRPEVILLTLSPSK